MEKILRANRAEVIAVSIFEYNKEEEEQKLRKAEYEAGIEAGVAEGELKKARETALSLAEMGLPVDKIAEAVKISRDKVEEWMKEIGLVMHIKDLGVDESMFEKIVEGTIISDSGYKTLTHDEIIEVLRKSL